MQHFQMSFLALVNVPILPLYLKDKIQANAPFFPLPFNICIHSIQRQLTLLFCSYHDRLWLKSAS